MNYIDKEGQKHIREFKYKGGDLSLSYKYLWSPIAEKILLVTPPTLAPNTITLFGFLLHVVATILLCLQVPFSQPSSTWKLYFYGFSVLTYQMLDNLDGKQARKLGNSTPLGMIMDHGCDALGVVFLSSGMARIICLQQSTVFMIGFISVVFSFYMSAWCQYHSNGIMILGKVNGVDDGIPLIWMCAFVSGFLGQAFWKLPVTILGLNLHVNEIFIYVVIVFSLAQIYSVIFQSGEEFTDDVPKALKDLFHFVFLSLTVLIIFVFSDIADSHIAAITLGFAFTMARTISYTLVCSVTHMKFQQIQPSVLVYTLVYSIYVLFCQKYISAPTIVYGVTAFVIIQYFVYVVSIANHIADTLGIKIFKVFKAENKK